MKDAQEQHAAGGAASEWSLAAVQKLLWSRRWLVVAVAAEVFLIVALVTFLKTPLYESSSRMVIERTPPKVLQGEDVMVSAGSEMEVQRFYQTQYLLLRDQALLRTALDLHGVRDSLRAALNPENNPAVAARLDDDRLANAIRANLKIEQVERSKIVRVSFRDPSPKVAADVVNAVVDAYRDYFVTTGLDARRDASKFLQQAIQEAQAEVLELDNELARKRREIAGAVTTGGTDIGKVRLESVDNELTASKARLARAEAKLSAYLNTPAGAIDEVRSNAQIQRFRDNLATMKKETAELEARVGAGWPRLRELKTAIAETEKTIAEEEQSTYQRVVAAARADAERERRNVERLSALLDTELRRTADIQIESGDFERLRQTFNQKRQALDRLLMRREEVALSAELRLVVERQVTVLDKAKPAERPSSPKKPMNLALGMAFGAFLGVAAAFLAEALDNKVRSGAQLSELARLPLLGSIPRLEGPARPRLIFAGKGKRRQANITPVMAARNNDVEESFRALRSSLMLAQAGHPPRILLLTSALPSEGKSTISANLSRTFGSFGDRTVLIDADLRHPRLHRVFDLKPTRGLTNVLASSMSVADAIVQTPFENLWLLPGGPVPPDPATLLDPVRFRQMIDELVAMGFQYVIVDTPPVMVFADTFNLVQIVEGVVLVARSQQTPKEAFRQTHESLRKMKAPLLGVVLNGEVSEDQSGSYYYRYYHYRRGYYRKAAEARAAAGMSEQDAPQPLAVPDEEAGSGGGRRAG